MKKNWITLGFNAKEICSVEKFVSYKKGELLQYINDIHFAHFDANILPSGRCSTKFSKKDMKNFLKICLSNKIKTTLLLNYGHYKLDDIKNILNKIYLPLGLSSVVVSDKYLAEILKKCYPELTIQGSCISYIDTIDGLLDEAKYGIELHNPATWTIRNMPFIQNIHKVGLKQKHMMSEGCARKCKLELWHRSEVLRDIYHDLYGSCARTITNIYIFLMGNWITIKQLKRMERYIDILKLPRSMFFSFDDLFRFITIYDTEEPYNIFDFWGSPLAQIREKNIIMSDVFDDEFFDKTISDEINISFLNHYVSKLYDIPFFTDKGLINGFENN